jgi:hypothetical protein
MRCASAGEADRTMRGHAARLADTNRKH